MPDVPEAPAEQDQPTTPEAPETDQPTSAEESFTDAFKPADLPEELRPTYEEAYKRLQSDYSKKTGEIAQERQEAQELREFAAAMQDPATRDQILQEQWGYQFEDGDEEEFIDPEEELRARLENVEGALTQQQSEEVQAAQSAQATDEIAEGIESLEKSFGNGFEFEPKTLKAISSYAEVHGPEAIPEIGEVFKGFVDEWIANKKESPRRISQGTPAQRAIDPTNQEERFKLYDEIAEEAAPSLE